MSLYLYSRLKRQSKEVLLSLCDEEKMKLWEVKWLTDRKSVWKTENEARAPEFQFSALFQTLSLCQGRALRSFAVIILDQHIATCAKWEPQCSNQMGFVAGIGASKCGWLWVNSLWNEIVVHVCHATALKRPDFDCLHYQLGSQKFVILEAKGEM